jgi:beta-lactam-binding protein with PASTA domain
MRFRQLLDKTRSKPAYVLIHLGLFVIALFVLFIIFSSIQKVYTHYGEALTVPDFSGLTIEQVEQVCLEKDLRFTVIDSTFVANTPFFTVVEQSPKASSKVKRKRMIYLTISTDKPPKVRIPNVIDVSLRQAVTLLEGFGLKVGEMKYVPGIAQNVVIRIERKGRVLKEGQLIDKGSFIDLVMEDGESAEMVPVQDLSGLTIEEAMFALSGFSLTIGATVYDKMVKDTTRAVVYKQAPEPSEDNIISKGSPVDVWLTTPDNFKTMLKNKPVEQEPN